MRKFSGSSVWRDPRTSVASWRPAGKDANHHHVTLFLTLYEPACCFIGTLTHVSHIYVSQNINLQARSVFYSVWKVPKHERIGTHDGSCIGTQRDIYNQNVVTLFINAVLLSFQLLSVSWRCFIFIGTPKVTYTRNLTVIQSSLVKQMIIVIKIQQSNILPYLAHEEGEIREMTLISW